MIIKYQNKVSVCLLISNFVKYIVKEKKMLKYIACKVKMSYKKVLIKKNLTK